MPLEEIVRPKSVMVKVVTLLIKLRLGGIVEALNPRSMPGIIVFWFCQKVGVMIPTTNLNDEDLPRLIERRPGFDGSRHGRHWAPSR